MRSVLFEWLIVLGCLNNVMSGTWNNPAHQMERVRTAVKEKAVKMKASIIEDVRTADIRLMIKDPAKPADSHPLLKSAEIDVNHAKSIFETGWMEFYTWVSDLDSEYTTVDKAESLFSSNHFNSTLNTLFILHDRCGNARDSNVIKIVEALKLRNFDVNYNIMLMDYRKFMCSGMSPRTGIFQLGFTPQLQYLAVEIGEFIFRGIIAQNIRPEQLNLIGLGTSAHLAGLVAKEVYELSGEKINSVLGLDPPISIRRDYLNSNNAKHVHVYHTFKLVPRVGARTGQATADFVFGGAKRGPQCRKALTTSCFKGFGMQLFVSTLLFPKMFAGRWCPNYHKFSEHFCDSNDYSFVSFPPDDSAKGIYQMEINYEFPFGKGLEGIFQVAEEEDDNGSGEVAKLSQQEYLHRLEIEVNFIRNEMMSCIHGVMTPTAIMRCIMGAQPSVRRLENNHLIRKLRCEPFPKSPTGKKCSYETRTHNAFQLPF